MNPLALSRRDILDENIKICKSPINIRSVGIVKKVILPTGPNNLIDADTFSEDLRSTFPQHTRLFIE